MYRFPLQNSFGRWNKSCRGYAAHPGNHDARADRYEASIVVRPIGVRARVDAARGADFDRLFLTDMIQHHRGAVQMVKELFESPGAGQDELVFKFASDVNVDQTTEIARMQRMLAILTIQGRAP